MVFFRQKLGVLGLEPRTAEVYSKYKNGVRNVRKYMRALGLEPRTAEV